MNLPSQGSMALNYLSQQAAETHEFVDLLFFVDSGMDRLRCEPGYVFRRGTGHTFWRAGFFQRMDGTVADRVLGIKGEWVPPQNQWHCAGVAEIGKDSYSGRRAGETISAGDGVFERLVA